MKNKEIEKILKKINNEETKKIIAYINKLEKEFAEEEKQSIRLFVANQDLIAEREKVIDYMKNSIELFSIMYKNEENEASKIMLEIKILTYERILEKYKK